MNETFLKKVRTFKTNYESSTTAYDSIKSQLKIPSNMEFGFIFETMEGGSINTSTQIPPTTANVYVGETPVLYIDENASLESGFLTLKVW